LLLVPDIMKRLTSHLLTSTFVFGSLLTVLPGCLDMSGDPEDDDNAGADDKADGWATVLAGDNLNGLWSGTIDGKKLTDDVVIESWPAVGVKVHANGKVYTVSLSGTKLVGTGAALDLKANAKGVSDDAIEGTLDGKAVKLVRDVSLKPAITMPLPGDRPFRMFLNEQLGPSAQVDRESYTKIRAADLSKFIKSCELYKSGSWQYKYIKGATSAERNANFDKIFSALDGLETTPHALIHSLKYSNAVKAQLKDQSMIGLALSNFGLYFPTGAGRAVRLPLSTDSMAYFITDRPTRAEKIGLVVMNTPTHGPLASTFGRQLLDMGKMPPADDATYARAMMELLVKSDSRSVPSLSASGKSAITDWYAVMAIEDYRGVAFGNAELGWGYNMTEVQFFGLVARSLARPGSKDSAGKPILAQVIVDNQLKPGDPSYADVLNGGNDMQEYPDMAQLKTLANDYLKTAHPELITEVKTAFAGIVPDSELDSRAQDDIFHYIGAQLYDSKDREAKLKSLPAADRAVRATTALFAALVTESSQFEAYILAHGVTKNNDPAMKSTGF
jgi:hypothetical protein